MDFIAKPFGWLLLFLYNLTNNYGIAVFLFALLVRLILLYFSMKSKKGMMRQVRFTPYLKELEKKYEGNKQKYQEEVAKLYKEEHISPTGGCLWSLIQYPILLALYRAIRYPITIIMGVPAEAYKTIQELLAKLGYTAPTTGQGAAYGQIFESQFISSHFSQFADISDRLQKISYNFLGLDLGSQPKWQIWTFFTNGEPLWPQLGLFLIPVVSAVTGYVASRIGMTSNGGALAPEAAGTNKMMMWMSPAISLWIGFALPGALGLYWIASSVFGALQDYILGKIYSKKLDEEDADRRARIKAREEELERKRLETMRLREEGATSINPNTSKRKIQKTEKMRAEQRAAEWQAANRPPAGKKEAANPSQVGDRPYARGRSYEPDRFAKNGETLEKAPPSVGEAGAGGGAAGGGDGDETPVIPEIDFREGGSEQNKDLS